MCLKIRWDGRKNFGWEIKQGLSERNRVKLQMAPRRWGISERNRVKLQMAPRRWGISERNREGPRRRARARCRRREAVLCLARTSSWPAGEQLFRLVHRPLRARADTATLARRHGRERDELHASIQTEPAMEHRGARHVFLVLVTSSSTSVPCMHRLTSANHVRPCLFVGS